MNSHIRRAAFGLRESLGIRFHSVPIVVKLHRGQILRFEICLDNRTYFRFPVTSGDVYQFTSKFRRVRA
jgi:hypothetical protein